jgi:hypothetical protein
MKVQRGTHGGGECCAAGAAAPDSRQRSGEGMRQPWARRVDIRPDGVAATLIKRQMHDSQRTLAFGSCSSKRDIWTDRVAPNQPWTTRLRRPATSAWLP